eukprot:1010943-Rhodomonas_salina.1
MLAGVLGQCTALVHLNLSGNAIGNEGPTRLAADSEMAECKALVHLDLAANKIGQKGGESPARLLGESRALEHLNMSNN